MVLVDPRGRVEETAAFSFVWKVLPVINLIIEVRLFSFLPYEAARYNLEDLVFPFRKVGAWCPYEQQVHGVPTGLLYHGGNAESLFFFVINFIITTATEKYKGIR